MKHIFYPLNSLADYEVKLYKNLFWVPINILGREELSFEKCRQIENFKFSRKIDYINNLYMAIQLFIVKKYETFDDNIYTQYGNVLWEFHKTAEEVDRSNMCGCASAATWLRNILEKKYNFVGMLWIANNIGNGHLINIIEKDKFLYFFDLYSMTNKFIDKIPYENGLRKELLTNKIVTGIFLRSLGYENFIEYHDKMMRLKKFEYKYTIILSDIMPPLSHIKNNGKIIYYMPFFYKSKIIELNTCNKISINFKDVEK